MHKGLSAMSGVAVGLGMMYFLDPDKGRRRRALIRDKTKHLWRMSGKALGRAMNKSSRDLTNRARGVIAEIQRSPGTQEVSDDVLADRVRSEMGHVVSRPGAIQVTADQGRVTLVGSVPENELKRLLRRISSVSGVREVQNRLSIEKGAEPESRSRAEKSIRTRWAPVLLGVIGSALTLYGRRRRTRYGRAMRILGKLLAWA